MDTPKPQQKSGHLLDDLESIRELLGDEKSQASTALDLDSIDPESIPLLSDIVEQSPQATATPTPAPAQPESPIDNAHALRATVRQSIGRDSEINRLDTELRNAAQLILQDVIDDFVPQIEAELKSRLEARLPRLLPTRRP
ncbi:DNA polymerase III subunit chi [Pseudomonas sp. M30-35]|uniref:DNA polymerase III subunit chi n=1 Tax=Pseudomonas sp. M30-35 TaxID=1981174 RepID=UPI000B3CEB58|nr:DNA polymerase III subunit chi [Pseudomonas sp. M30-35]ARU89435.1 DNA polymerase III subunit chi [Pseudomonas sp. M30-35]